VHSKLRDGAEFELDLSEWPQAQAFLRNTYDPETVDFVVSHLGNGGVFFDVGAHIGLVSFQVLRRAPFTTIHAFEPRLATASDFKLNATFNPGNVTLNECGLSAAAGELRFNPATHSINPAGEVVVPVITLDGYLGQHGIETVDVMKVDVEGHEASVLEGATAALGDHRIRAITMEQMDAHGDTSRAAQLLKDAGYKEVGGPWLPDNVAWLAPARKP
jgi:FkbM family methyltransferase